MSIVRYALLSLLAIVGFSLFFAAKLHAQDNSNGQYDFPSIETNPVRPNIVYILCDDLGYGDVHCLNPERGKIPTPHMDRLATEGMICSDAHSGSSVCTPTRYGILTGRYSWRSRLQSGVLQGFSQPLIPNDRLTVASLLKQQGYATACIGKWHLGMNLPQPITEGKIQDGPTTLGFDYFFGISASLDMPPYAFIENDQFTEAPTVRRELYQGRPGPSAPGFECKDGLPTFARKAQEFIEQQKANPFFLYLPLNSPHTPLAPNDQWIGKSGLGDYGDFVMETDWAIGQVLKTLETTGVADNTFVIVTSDNGCAPYVGLSHTDPANSNSGMGAVEQLEAAGHFPSGPLRGYKSDIWDGGHRVPFIARWPGKITAGTTNKQTLCLTDLLATCAEIVGTPLPPNAGEDSISMLPTLLGKSVGVVRESTVHHSIRGDFSLRQGNWKLVLCADSGGWSQPTFNNAAAKALPVAQLYDLESDLAESKNLQAEYPKKVRQLTRDLERMVQIGRSTPGEEQANDVPVEIYKPRSGRPNVIYIMADELGYFEPGFMGGDKILTPNLDRMAAEGIRFNNLFAGSSVCAPTRCCFLTGKHSGHTSVRSNGGGTPLRADETTIASMLKPLGYATGGFGKWGCGGRDSTGVPENHGFDQFFGYYDQVHAHSYYPPYLIRNSQEIPLQGNVGTSGETYSHYEIHDAAVKFIRDHAKQQFFAYLPITPPHGLFDIPDSDPAWQIYKDKPWTEPQRRYAAMVTMVDRQVGEILQLVKDLGIEDNTLVVFSGDNGGADYFSSPEHPRGFFSANLEPNGGREFRGKKGNLYEGGLRIPFIARWPEKIQAGQVSDHLGYFPDILPTIAELTGASPPEDIDGISILPTLVGEKLAGHAQEQHEYLYWEIGGQTAIRQGNWRAVRPKPNAKWQLFDLSNDPGERNDVSENHPMEVDRLAKLAAAAHQPVREGSFTRTDRHQRDRRAKFGKQDEIPAANNSSTATKEKMPTEGMLSNKTWKLIKASSENVGNGKFAINAFDGDVESLWHTRFGEDLARPPHELIIDLGDSYQIEGVVYLARQDRGWNGTIKDMEVYVSDQSDRFEQPKATVTLSRTKSPQKIPFPAAVGRYIKIRALSEIDGKAFASIAEIGVIGK